MPRDALAGGLPFAGHFFVASGTLPSVAWKAFNLDKAMMYDMDFHGSSRYDECMWNFLSLFVLVLRDEFDPDKTLVLKVGRFLSMLFAVSRAPVLRSEVPTSIDDFRRRLDQFQSEEVWHFES